MTERARPLPPSAARLVRAAGALIAALLAGALLAAGPAAVRAQGEPPPSAGGVSDTAVAAAVPDTLAPDTASEAAWPFAPGERASYAVTFGPVHVGTASLAVEAVDTVRGTRAYRVAMAMRGGTFFYRLDDRQASWIAPRPFRSLRFEQHMREGGYRRDRLYCLDQRAGRYWSYDQTDDGSWRATPGHGGPRDGRPMPPAALDEIAFLYFARTLPLVPGTTYRFSRYFEAEGNPVVLEVLRRETITVPAGRFATIVVRPIIRTGGMFGEGGKAEVYFSDDPRHIVVKLETSMKVGRLNLYLEDYAPGAADSARSDANAADAAVAGAEPDQQGPDSAAEAATPATSEASRPASRPSCSPPAAGTGWRPGER